MIGERLGSYGFDPERSYSEWMEGLAIIQEVALASDGDCRWIAETAEFDAAAAIRNEKRMLDFLDRQDPGKHSQS